MLQSPLLKKYCGGPKKVSQGPAFKGANSKNSSCWKGYRKEGTKTSASGTGETVNNCVKIGSK